MITSGETNWVKVQGESLYYLCNFSTNLKIFQNKKLFKIPRRKHSLQQNHNEGKVWSFWELQVVQYGWNTIS